MVLVLQLILVVKMQLVSRTEYTESLGGDTFNNFGSVCHNNTSEIKDATLLYTVLHFHGLKYNWTSNLKAISWTV